MSTADDIRRMQDAARIVARHRILRAANKKTRNSRKVFAMRNINEAVFRCRQRRLVEPGVLTTAGFNVKGHK